MDEQLGSYRLSGRLGAGGMGEVYRAHDTKLSRDVAIKLLPRELADDADRRARLVREAQSAAALNHPNICTIYDVGDSGGRTFIAMELVEGEPLNGRIGGRPLPSADVVRLGLQLADAVAHAHEHGVVHRDLKTANVMVTASGRIKVLDFGLAKRAIADALGDLTTRDSLTSDGAILGTVPYMAPEQLRGRAADVRTDIWALGVILYEMASGVRPFSGATSFELSAAILNDAPPPLPSNVPRQLQAIVARCLEKEPARRYQRASEVHAALETVDARSSVPLEGVRRTTFATWIAAGALVAVLAAFAAVAFNSLSLRSRGGSAPTIRSVAVLPLDNLSRDPEQDYFAAGMHEALITDLARIGLQKVIAKPSSDIFKGTKKPLRDVGRELGVDGLVTGAVLRAGNRVQLTAQLVKAATGEIVWANRYERNAGDILALQNELVSAIAREVRATISPEQSARLANRRRVDPAAHDAYLRGRSMFAQMAGATPDRKYMDGAIEAYEKAIRIDPSYAAPYAGLAWMYLTVSETSTFPPSQVAGKARAAARKAIELDDGSAEAHAALGGVLLWLEWDWAGAEREITRALELNPDSVDALIHSQTYALLIHNRIEDAEATSQRILSLDPLNPFSRVQRVWVAILSREFDESIRRAQSLLEVWPGNIMSPFFMAQAYAAQHKGAETSAECDKVVAATSGAFSMQTTATCVAALGTAGRAEQARRLLQTLEHPPAQVWLDPPMMAAAYGGVGDLDRALDWFAKGLEERAPNMIYANVGPAFDFGRRDARFQSLLKRMSFPEHR
jgi:serine/threonine protein kinase/tetratricopeptide (TPR) repeat protein